SCPNATQTCSNNPGGGRRCADNIGTASRRGRRGACISLCNNNKQCFTGQTCEGTDACDCPGPHPFVLVPGNPHTGSRSVCIPRGTLAHDSDGVKLPRSEEHTSELQSRSDLGCRLLP